MNGEQYEHRITVLETENAMLKTQSKEQWAAHDLRAEGFTRELKELTETVNNLPLTIKSCIDTLAGKLKCTKHSVTLKFMWVAILVLSGAIGWTIYFGVLHLAGKI